MKFFLPALALFITGLVTDHAFAEVTALGVAQGIGTFAGLILVGTAPALVLLLVFDIHFCRLFQSLRCDFL
jgi:hypothetical protein